MVNGTYLQVKEAEGEYNIGQMAVDMRGIGKMIKLILKEGFFIRIRTFMKANGLRTKQMDGVYTFIRMAPGMKVDGSMIIKKEKVKKYGQMALFS